MAETSNVYTALTGSGTSWSATSSYTVRPRWVRLDSVVNWADGAALAKVFSYDTAKQNTNQFGNVTKVQERDGSTSGTLLRWTETEYFPNVSANVVNLPARMSVYDGSNNCKAETRSIYGAYYSGSTYVSNIDNNYQSAPYNPLPVKQEVALGGCSSTATISTYDANWAITRYAYDAYGNQTTANRTGAASGSNIIVTTDFDSTYHLFPIHRYNNANSAYDETAFYYGVNPAVGDPAITDAKAQWGALAEWCGVNESCTRYAYDDYGRVNLRWDGLATAAAWGTATNANVVWGYAMYGSAGWTRNAITEWHAPRCYGNFSRKVYNGLGQLIQLQGPQQDRLSNVDGCNPGSNSKEVDVSYQYDALGNQSRAGMPVATTASYINRAADWTKGYTAATYDLLGRPTTVAAPNGETTEYKYVGRTTRVTGKGYGGEAGTNRVLKWAETDALGNLYRVRTYDKPFEEGGATLAEISFTHDVLGNLTQVTHPSSLGNSTMSYDSAGRKTAMTDISLGSWSYSYDRQGRLTSQTDACANGTTLTYNTLDQLTGKSFTDATGCGSPGVPFSVSYTYGSSGTATGQLTKVQQSDSSYSKDLTYNAQGLLQDETVKIVGGATAGYKTSYGYDSFLRPATTTYPDNEVLTLSYNSMGLPAKLVSGSTVLVNGATDVNAVADAVTYDEAGRLTQMKFPAGGNLWQTRGYHAWTATSSSYPGDGNGRLYSIHTGTTQGGQDRLNLAAHYDSFGNIKYYFDNAAYNTFTYDNQNRLLTAYSQSYGFDALGRLSNYEGTSPTLNTTFPAYMPKFSGYTFDANGNVITRGGRTLVWDVQNQLSQVKNGTVTEESYLYDPDGIRVKKTVGSTNSYYPFAHYEVSGSTVTKYYFFNGQRVAMKQGTVLTYLHGDHLGSTVLETNSSGNQTTDEKYYAYGRQRDTGPVVTDHKFTGQKLDGSGLMYYQSRYYDPTTGVFISPDSIVPDATSVFSYNRFMYSSGNPLNRVDPTGHKDIAMDGGGGLGGLVGGSGFAQAVANDVFQLAVALASAAGIIAPSVEQAPSVIDGIVQMADQAAHNSAQQNAGSSNTGDPGGLDPNDPFVFNKFTNLVRDRGFENLQRDLQSLNRGNRVGAERVTEVMNQLGDQVQRLGVKDRVPGVTTSDIDILDIAGNVHEVGAHTASQLGMKFQYAQAWIAQSSNPNAQIFYWHFGKVTQDILDTAQRWNVTVQVVK